MANDTMQDGAGDAAGSTADSVANPVRKAGPLGGPFGLLIAVASLGVAFFLVWRLFNDPPVEPPSTIPVTYICAETGISFPHVLKVGERAPVYSPHSKKNTGYRAEFCYWTKDGGIKNVPDYVLLNEDIGKPGPTLCKVCGRVVVPHNPRPKLPPEDSIKVPEATPSASANEPATVPTTQSDH